MWVILNNKMAAPILFEHTFDHNMTTISLPVFGRQTIMKINLES